jgi:hypothetical protein
LVAADHVECQRLGEAILKYLISGDPSGEPEIERAYADVRAAILAQPAEAREGVARARASDAIVMCDQRLDEQESQAQAEREKEERDRQRQEDADAAAEAERLRAERFAAGCAGVGGEVDGLSCTVDYPGWPDMFVPLDDNGELIEEDVATNRADCANALEDARISAQDGYPWSELPQFYEESGVCTFGRP